MSIQYKKENGYPCDLELGVTAIPGSRPIITVKIDGKDRNDLWFNTDEPSSARRAFAKGVFAGIDYAEKKRS